METLRETSEADQAHLNTSAGASMAAASPVTYGKGRRYSHREHLAFVKTVHLLSLCLNQESFCVSLSGSNVARHV